MHKDRAIAWLRWLFVKPVAIWACICALAVAALFVWLAPWIDPETRARWAGTALQLLGLVTTAIGIQQTRRLFGHPNVLQQIASWYKERPKRNVSIQLSGSAILVAGSSAVLSVGHTAAPPGSTVEQRLQRIEEWLPMLQQQDIAIEQKLNDEKTSRDKSDGEERAAREAADARLHDSLERTATGGLRLSAVGLSWLIVGTIFAGFPPEIAAYVNPAGAHVRPTPIPSAQPTWLVVFWSLYWLIALCFSIFYGVKAITIMTDADPKTIVGARRFHQIWLNFFGALTGWLCLAFVTKKLLHFVAIDAAPTIGWAYAALALVGFVGVTGFLPYTIVKLLNSISALVEKIPGLQKPAE